MRQTNSVILKYNIPLMSICIILMLFGISTQLMADITSVTLNVTSSGGDSKINGSGQVTLNANWAGDTPPFSAVFKLTGGGTLGTETTSGNSASLVVSGAVLGNGSKSFEVSVIETSVPNAQPGTAAGDKAVEVDLIPPDVTATVVNGPIFGNNQTVRVQITCSNEIIQAPTVTCNGKTFTQEGSLSEGAAFTYSLQLDSSFTNGEYTVTVTAKDTSQPTESANTTTTTTSFTVGPMVTGPTEITSSSPPSPTNATTVSLSGTCPNGAATVELLDGDTTAATVSVSGSSWSIGISPSEGTHSYVAVSKDANGTEISRSSAFTLVVDRTPPSKPVPDTSGLPTNTNQSSILVPVEISGVDSEVAKPLTIQPIVNGVEVGTAQNVETSPISVNVPLQEGLNNITFRVKDAAGNTSDPSDVISITRDTSSDSSSTIVTLDAPVVLSFPIPDNYKLAAGTYSVKMIFGKEMDNSVRPQIDITTAGGSNISSTSGSWVASNTYIGQFTIPPNGGDAYDGNATMVISNAKDVFGNILDPINVPSSGGTAFSIDSTPPVSAFDDEDSIYVPQDGTPIRITGTVTDDSGTTPGSGIEYVKLIWQEFNGSGLASQSVPLQAASPSPWSIDWDASGLNPGRYKLWVRAVDRAKPNGNVEEYSTKPYRIVIVDRDVPSVSRISLDDMLIDIAEMNGGAPPVIASAVTKLTAVINDAGNSGIAFSSPLFEFSLTHDETGQQIRGNYTNNGSDTIYFTFPELTENGTYTIKVVPVDNSGNVGASATRQIILDTTPPSDVTFEPPNESIANKTNIALELDQVWAVINDPMADHTKSVMEVRYNGNIIGEQIPNIATATVWDIGGPTQILPTDQSGDGRYDITVIPRDIYGNVGSAVRSYFFYDSVPPVITSFTPAIDPQGGSPTWFGLSQSEISIIVSDAPKDIITYKDNMTGSLSPIGFDFSTVQIPGDPNWYNGQGSGVNTTTSSFTIKVNGVESGPAIVSGLKFSQPRPDIPADTSAGVVDVQVEINIQDKVNNGQTIPNSTIASYTLKFDYLKPSIPEITAPIAPNNKYCKNTVTIEGSVGDEGTSDELMIKRIEWSENESAFTPFTVTSLPQKNASFTASLDITNRSDGTYSIDIRAVDLGDNVSDNAQVIFVVDRTPPEAPEMIVPLPDARTNRRGLMFKWTASADADHYLLQIADDSSFNNILNKQTNTEYADLVGQVTAMTENSFSVPKDGTYYWRVAAIETCVDGYNISAFSTVRRFTVDTVKPTVVEVQPTPSSANKITSGMVTFTIRFSELVDTSVPPNVRLTSNGGQVMNIELKSYTEDTWVGSTVIPKDNSALYNGNAIITIENAVDLAGNIMEVDSTHNVVIDTGPAFTTKIFSNPANELEIMVVTKSSEALQAPPTCTIEQNSVRTPVIMNFLKERYYAGAYKIDINSPGKAYIDLSGTDLYGMTGYDSVEFIVAELNQDTRLNITSASGNANLKAAENSAYKVSCIYLLDRDNLDSPFTNEVRARVLSNTVVPSNKSKELMPLMALDEVGPTSLRLRKCLLYTAKIIGLKTDIANDKIAVYRLGKDGRWIYQGGKLKGNKISAQLTGLGRLALMADMTPPSLEEHKPHNMEELENNMPEISGKVVDNGSGFKKDSFKLFIDDIEVKSVTVNADGSFKYKPRLPMKKGKHEIRVEATDLTGNELRTSFWVTTLGDFAIGEFMPYPNPVTGNSMYFNYDFNQTAERVVLKIYDVAGHKVAQYDTFDFANARRGRFRWDLRNDNGKIVANGVYFYKLEITKKGQTFKKRGKFAIMR